MFFALLKRVKTEKFKRLWYLIMHWNLKFQVSSIPKFVSYKEIKPLMADLKRVYMQPQRKKSH